MEKEIWGSMPFSKGLYEVSNYGNVRSWIRLGDPRQSKRDKPYYKKIPIGKRGYYEQTFNLRELNVLKIVKIHRVVAQLFVPNPNNLPCVNHLDGNKLNNFYKNLEWCTNSHNLKHAHEIGLIKKGEESSKTKLTNKQALEIFNLNKPYKYIAEMYETNVGIVYSIKAGTAWKSVTGKIRNKNARV